MKLIYNLYAIHQCSFEFMASICHHIYYKYSSIIVWFIIYNLCISFFLYTWCIYRKHTIYSILNWKCVSVYFAYNIETFLLFVYFCAMLFEFIFFSVFSRQQKKRNKSTENKRITIEMRVRNKRNIIETCFFSSSRI